MKSLNILYLVAGILAILYGLLILWNVASGQRDQQQDDWLNSEEITRSKFHNMQHLQHLLQPERKNISSSRSKGRGYAMVAVGIALIIWAFA
ncbi:MAG: hypothetical protein WCC11_09145 [Gammaproteobacteria bacterium]